MTSRTAADTLGEQIQQARRSREWTQEQLARRLGVSVMSVSRWERGYLKPDPKNWKKLCKVLGMERPACPTCGQPAA